MNTLSVPIVKRHKIAEGTAEAIFDAGESFRFVPGQYITLTLPEPAASALSPRERFRDFSLASSSATLPKIAIAFRISHSPFKRALLALPEGATISLSGPKGVFTLPETARSVIFIAGGIGITPFASIIRSLDGGTFCPVLYFFNRSRESAPYLSEMETARNEGRIELVSVIGKLSPENFREEDLRPPASSPQPLWYIAGPPGLVREARGVLADAGVLDENIRTEEFTGYD